MRMRNKGRLKVLVLDTDTQLYTYCHGNQPCHYLLKGAQSLFLLLLGIQHLPFSIILQLGSPISSKRVDVLHAHV